MEKTISKIKIPIKVLKGFEVEIWKNNHYRYLKGKQIIKDEPINWEE